jgi:hypothetical protein
VSVNGKPAASKPATASSILVTSAKRVLLGETLVDTFDP